MLQNHLAHSSPSLLLHFLSSTHTLYLGFLLPTQLWTLLPACSKNTYDFASHCVINTNKLFLYCNKLRELNFEKHRRKKSFFKHKNNIEIGQNATFGGPGRGNTSPYVKVSSNCLLLRHSWPAAFHTVHYSQSGGVGDQTNYQQGHYAPLPSPAVVVGYKHRLLLRHAVLRNVWASILPLSCQA